MTRVTVRRLPALVVLAAFCCGAVAGSLLVALLSHGDDRAQAVDLDPLAASVLPQSDSIGAVLVELRRVEQRLDEAIAAWSGANARVAVESTAQPSAAAVEAAGETESADRRRSFEWVGALDPVIATALVERGLTPFEPNVATPVRSAGDALRAAKAELRTSLASLQEELVGHRMDSSQYRTALVAHEKKFEDQKSATLARLATELDRLSR